jgi:hypothetical protein
VILLDTDVAAEVLRGNSHATAWFSSLPRGEIIVLSGFVALESIWGTKDEPDQTRTEKWMNSCRIIWLSARQCEQADHILRSVHPKNAIGPLDAMIAQTALVLNLPLHTFNQKHFNVVPGLRTIHPFARQ